MHFSTTLVLSSVFSLSLTLPSPQLTGPVAKPGRLLVNYDFNKQTMSSGGLKAGSSESLIKASVPFTIKAYNSESPIHLMNITASYDRFWVGNVTNSTCPEQGSGDPPVPQPGPCPTGNDTAIETTSTGGANLDVQAPGGQAIYIGPRGQLRFQNPRVPVPTDASKIVFALQPNPIPAPPGVAAFTFSGVGKASGFLACPVTPQGPWQVFADLAIVEDAYVPGGNVSNCIGFDALATNYTSPLPAAYQYY